MADAIAVGNEFGCNIVIKNTSRILLSVKCNGTLKFYHYINKKTI